MPKMNRFILFLNSRYSTEELRFYRNRLKDAAAVAVDGGIRFFLKNKRYPDIMVGDFDSSPRLSQKYLSHFEVFSFPPRKDKTDSQLAVELALGRGATAIDICGALGHTEIDHTLENIFLLHLIKQASKKLKRKIESRIISPHSQIILLENEKTGISGKIADYLSVIPLTGGVTVRFTGLSYPAPKAPLKFGDSLSLRNQFARSCATVAVKGKALVVTVRKR